jgi:hypothetical protein
MFFNRPVCSKNNPEMNLGFIEKLCLQLGNRRLKPEPMKIRLIFALGLLIAALISCQCIRNQSTASGRGSVQIDEHSVLIPGTAISSADQDALNKIFRKYDGSLYRIAVYENGSLKKQIGTMDEMQMGEIAKEYSTNATANGLTSWINQIGARTHVTHYTPTTHVTRAGGSTHVTRSGDTTHVTHPGDTTHVTHPGQPTHVTHPEFASIDQESDSLVKEVTPILEKYSK